MRLGIVLAIVTAAGSAHAETVDDLTATARNVAREGRCDAVPALASRVQALDGEYYARVFAVDPVIAACTRVEPRLQTGGPPSLTPPLPPEPPRPSGSGKDPATATLLSLGFTAGGLGLAALGDHERIPALSTVGSIMFLVGPTTGHAYAGHTWNAGLGARLGGIGLALLGGVLVLRCIEGCEDGDSAAEAGAVMFVGGGLLYAGGGIYEIATAGDAAHRYNREHGIEVTLVPTGTGLALAGAF